MIHEDKIKEDGICIAVPALQPGGCPSVTEGCAIVEVVV
jgi:hypothetical protein